MVNKCTRHYLLEGMSAAKKQIAATAATIPKTIIISGMIAGFELCLFYLVVGRYYPGIGVKYFGMTSLLNPVTGKPIIPDLSATMALPNAMESWPTLAHPLANKVVWFNLNNINCGLLGMPLGFLVIYVVSLFTKAPSAEMMAFIDGWSSSTKSANRADGRCWKRRPDRPFQSDRGGARRAPLH